MIAVLEYLTGPKIGVSFFFVVPITVIAWNTGKIWAYAFAIFCAIIWGSVDKLLLGQVLELKYIVWNSLIRLGYFIITAAYVLEIKRSYSLQAEKGSTAERLSIIKSKMVSLVNHEYRNALSAMKIAVDIVADHQLKVEPEDRDRAVSVLKATINHLQDSTATFLNLASVEEGSLGVQIRSIDARAAIAKSLEFLRELARSKGLRFEFQSPETGLLVQADPEALAVIVDNLVSNAVKYTHAGGFVKVRIEKDPAHPAQVLISVEDTGIGIDPKDQRKILEGYYRTKEARLEARGFGIGLVVVRELVERLGSHLLMRSVPMQGTTFSFALPLGSDGAHAA